MSARDEAERRWPKSTEDTLSDRVDISRHRSTFEQGAEWAVEETPERIEAMARAMWGDIWEGLDESDRDESREDARAALATLQLMVLNK